MSFFQLAIVAALTNQSQLLVSVPEASLHITVIFVNCGNIWRVFSPLLCIVTRPELLFSIRKLCPTVRVEATGSTTV